MSEPVITAVDCHAHVFERGLPLASRRRHAPDYDALLGDYLALLDANHISHGVLVQPSFLGTDNSYFVDALRQHPARLRGVAVVNTDITDAELAALDAVGVVGMRFNLVGLEWPDLASPAWVHLLARLRELKWHLEVHRDAADLAPLLKALLPSGCALVVDHFGRPKPGLGRTDPAFEALLQTAETGQVWVKLSAAYRHAIESGLPASERNAASAHQDAEQACLTASALLGAFGAERLVWGSDWPHTQHQDLVDFARSRALLDEWVPDALQRGRILVGTPAALFRFR